MNRMSMSFFSMFHHQQEIDLNDQTNYR